MPTQGASGDVRRGPHQVPHLAQPLSVPALRNPLARQLPCVPNLLLPPSGALRPLRGTSSSIITLLARAQPACLAPADKIPTVSGMVMDLVLLYREVCRRGGIERARAPTRQAWRERRCRLSQPPLASRRRSQPLAPFLSSPSSDDGSQSSHSPPRCVSTGCGGLSRALSTSPTPPRPPPLRFAATTSDCSRRTSSRAQHGSRICTQHPCAANPPTRCSRTPPTACALQSSCRTALPRPARFRVR